MIRLQKLLSAAGVASRRAAERLIEQGRITVNGRIIQALGAKADPAVDDVRVDGKRVKASEGSPVYLLLHKPRGYVTTRRDPQGRRTVLDLVPKVHGYVYPVGRLDYDSEGLVLLTSDGDLAAYLTHPRSEVERVYEAVVRGEPSDAVLEKLRRGVFIDGRRTLPATVRRGRTAGREPNTSTLLTLTLREGRNRQVRKMCAAVGHPVMRLTRTRMGPLRLGTLKPGDSRLLTRSEVSTLRKGMGETAGPTARGASGP